MAKFDVYRLRDGGALVVDCQADLLDGLNTRFVVPLLPIDAAPKPAARLNPLFEVHEVPRVLLPQFAATVPASECRERVASLAGEAIAIGNALDMLISGF